MLIYYLQLLDTPEEKLRFEDIYRDHRSLMLHVAQAVLHNREDAEDAVHNAFLRLIKHFSRFQKTPSEELRPLLIDSARNEAISLLRKRREACPLEDWDAFSDSASAVSSYHDLVETFTRLPPTYRAVMEMKLLLGWSDGEIAAKLGLSKTAVSTRASRGRQLLREIVTKEGFSMDG